MPPSPVLDATARDLQLLGDEFSRCVRRRDTGRLVDFFYSDDALLQVAGRPPLVGRAAIEGYFEQAFNSGLIDLRQETNLFESGEELACAAGGVVTTYETQPGLLHAEPGKFATVLRRQGDGRWRAIVHCLSSNEG
jgi:ketosteroid isomerase-like protein